MAELSIETREGFGLVTIMARKGVFADRIGSALGMEAPVAPAYRIGFEGTALVGTGPGMWLGYAPTPDADWSENLQRRVDGLASVSDQSGGYRIVRLSGAGARVVLRRGAPIDFDPSVFGSGSAVSTVISHIGVIVWQLDDAPTYEIAVFRSFFDSFRHWLDQTVRAL